MKLKFISGALGGALALSCVVAEQARAARVYNYTGLPFAASHIFDSTPPAGTYTTSMSVTGNVTLQNPLPASLFSLTDVTADVLSFSFSDGRNTITDLNATSFTFFFRTDAVGNIFGWQIVLFNKDPTYPNVVGSQNRMINIASINDTATITECIQLITDGCINQIDLGAPSSFQTADGWTVDPVPLPAALPLFAGGVGLIGLLARRRKQSTAARLH